MDLKYLLILIVLAILAIYFAREAPAPWSMIVTLIVAAVFLFTFLSYAHIF